MREPGDLRILVREGFLGLQNLFAAHIVPLPEFIRAIEGEVPACHTVFIALHAVTVVRHHVHISPSSLDVDHVPLVVAAVFQYAGDTNLLAEEPEAVSIGHTDALQLTVLGQHLVGPRIAGFVVGNAVTDASRNLPLSL